MVDCGFDSTRVPERLRAQVRAKVARPSWNGGGEAFVLYTCPAADLMGSVQSPGRVVTLIHQEDWHEFSPSVSLAHSSTAGQNFGVTRISIFLGLQGPVPRHGHRMGYE